MISKATITRPANTTAYAAGDVINGDGVTIPIELPVNGEKDLVILATHLMSSNEASTPAIDIYFFSESFTIAADNAAFAPSDSQIKSFLGKVSHTEWSAFAACKISDSPAASINLPNVSYDSDMTATNGTSVYAVLVAAAAYTPISGEEITVKIDLV